MAAGVQQVSSQGSSLGTGHEVRPVQMTRRGALDDQESVVVGESPCGVFEQVVVNVVQQRVGA
ncbi:hypothetical protein [Streptomyces fodineus]|uniref:hypothetical protein n=1 Tax=Streptomyces fodineus TaxID=1904616 RepID=UPI00131CD5D3|nr:hypothetical protein [Streptomyces fodineus]